MATKRRRRKLSKRSLLSLKRRLLGRRAELVQEGLRRHRDRQMAAPDQVGDAADRAATDLDKDFVITMAEVDAAEVVATNEALERLESGEFGLCETCGQPISLARLKVLPLARLCLGCKRAEEGRPQAHLPSAAVRRTNEASAPDDWDEDEFDPDIRDIVAKGMHTQER